MANQPLQIVKTVSALPIPLAPNVIYLVRVGQGYDLYATDTTGSNAYKINVSTSQLTQVIDVANGGTGANNVSQARTNLGLKTAATYDVGNSPSQIPILAADNTGLFGSGLGGYNAVNYSNTLSYSQIKGGFFQYDRNPVYKPSKLGIDDLYGIKFQRTNQYNGAMLWLPALNSLSKQVSLSVHGVNGTDEYYFYTDKNIPNEDVTVKSLNVSSSGLATTQTNLGVDKVVSANTRLTTAKQTFPNVYVDSNGQLQKTQFATWLDHAKMYNGLVPNGSFQMGDGTGWKLETSGLLTRDTTDFPFGAFGCLKYTGGSTGLTLTLDKIAVNPYMLYRLSCAFKYEKYATSGMLYAGMTPYDVDGNTINFGLAYHVNGTVTTLAQDLKVGDTVVSVTSLSNWTWDNGQNNGIKFYTYKDSRGYLYDPATMPYSRYVSNNFMWNTTASSYDMANNTIALNKAWSYANPNDPQGIWRAGTKIAQMINTGAGNIYNLKSGWMGGQTGISDWQFNTQTISGIGMSLTNNTAEDVSKFRAGTAYIAPVFLINYLGNSANTNDVTKISHLYFEKI